jgi:hypothetical protein
MHQAVSTIGHCAEFIERISRSDRDQSPNDLCLAYPDLAHVSQANFSAACARVTTWPEPTRIDIARQLAAARRAVIMSTYRAVNQTLKRGEPARTATFAQETSGISR